MRPVAYLRVSTDRQAEHGFGLEVQEQRISAWALAHGHDLVAVVVVSDEGVSGTREAADRPGLSQVLKMLEDGDVDAFVVARLDRLARTLMVQEVALRKVWSNGGRVFSVDVGEIHEDDPDDPMRTAFHQMAGVAAQLERGMITQRLRAGRRHKVARGGYGGGEVPFGFRVVAGDFVVDEREALTRARIRELRSRGASLRAIAAQLELEGLKPRRATRWHPGTLGPIAARLEQAA
jgi:DNA invertase Pin-like site-specific DNA recombinase